MSLVLASNHCFALCSSHTSHPSLFLGQTVFFSAYSGSCTGLFCLPTFTTSSCPQPDKLLLILRVSTGKQSADSSPRQVRSPNKQLLFSQHYHTIAQLLANIRKNELKQHSDQGNSWEIWPRFYFFEIFDNTYSILLIKAIKLNCFNTLFLKYMQDRKVC